MNINKRCSRLKIRRPKRPTPHILTLVFNMSKIQNETDVEGSRIPIENYIIIMSKGNHN